MKEKIYGSKIKADCKDVKILQPTLFNERSIEINFLFKQNKNSCFLFAY